MTRLTALARAMSCIFFPDRFFNIRPQELRLFATATALVIAPERFSRELLLNAEFLRQEREQQLGQPGQRNAVSATHPCKQPVTELQKALEGRSLIAPE